MKKILLSIVFLHLLSSLFAQVDGGNYVLMGRSGVGTTMTTDYQCIGINPANLGLKTKYETKHVTLGLFDMGLGFFAQGVTNAQFREYVVDPLTNNTPLTPSQSIDAANLMKNNAINFNADIMILGLAIQTEKLGGLGFKISDHINGYGAYKGDFTSFGYSGALSTVFFDSLTLSNNAVVPNDPNNYNAYLATGIQSGSSNVPISLGQIVNGSKTQHHYYRAISASYAKKVWGDELFSITAGVTLKYIMGYNYLDATAENNRLSGLVAISPSFAEGDTVLSNVPTKENKGNFFTPSGNGFGADIGITGMIKENIKFGISLLNIGSVTYTTNANKLRDTVFSTATYETDAFENLNDLIYWDAVSSFKVKLPTMLRIGGSIALLENKLEVGADVVIPLNDAAGNLNTNYYAIGGDYYIFRWLRVSSGLNMGGNFANVVEKYKTTVNVPLGITFIVGENGGWETGLATRDIQSLLFQGSKGVNPSLGFGFFRFRF